MAPSKGKSSVTLSFMTRHYWQFESFYLITQHGDFIIIQNTRKMAALHYELCIANVKKKKNIHYSHFPFVFFISPTSLTCNFLFYPNCSGNPTKKKKNRKGIFQKLKIVKILWSTHWIIFLLNPSAPDSFVSCFRISLFFPQNIGWISRVFPSLLSSVKLLSVFYFRFL